MGEIVPIWDSCLYLYITLLAAIFRHKLKYKVRVTEQNYLVVWCFIRLYLKCNVLRLIGRIKASNRHTCYEYSKRPVMNCGMPVSIFNRPSVAGAVL